MVSVTMASRYARLVKELVPIVLAAEVWGKQWSGKNIMAYEAVVAIINKGDSRDAECMHLMRCLAFFQAKFHFTLYAQHISGSLNDLADALSRDRLHYFMANHSQALNQLTALPPELLDLTIVRKPDWMSQTWTELWKATFAQDWCHQPNKLLQLGQEKISQVL